MNHESDEEAPEVVTNVKAKTQLLSTLKDTGKVKQKKSKKPRKRDRIEFEDKLNQKTEEDDELDPSVLQQVVQEELEEKQRERQENKRAKSAKLLDKNDIPVYHGGSKSPSHTVFRNQRDFEEYRIKVVERQKHDLYSMKTTIPKEITSWLKNHFYGDRIKRVDPLVFKHDRNTYIGPSPRFLKRDNHDEDPFD